MGSEYVEKTPDISVHLTIITDRDVTNGRFSVLGMVAVIRRLSENGATESRSQSGRSVTASRLLIADNRNHFRFVSKADESFHLPHRRYTLNSGRRAR